MLLTKNVNNDVSKDALKKLGGSHTSNLLCYHAYYNLIYQNIGLAIKVHNCLNCDHEKSLLYSVALGSSCGAAFDIIEHSIRAQSCETCYNFGYETILKLCIKYGRVQVRVKIRKWRQFHVVFLKSTAKKHIETLRELAEQSR